MIFFCSAKLPKYNNKTKHRNLCIILYIAGIKSTQKLNNASYIHVLHINGYREDEDQLNMIQFCSENVIALTEL